MSRETEGPATAGGPVLLGLIGAAPVDAALRRAFAEADHRGVPLHLVLAGPASAGHDIPVSELIQRWAEKYPDIVVTTRDGAGLDAAVILAAASHGCGLLVVPEPADATCAALVRAVARRAHCPVVVAG